MQPRHLTAPSGPLWFALLVVFVTVAATTAAVVVFGASSALAAQMGNGWFEPLAPMPGTSAGFLANNCGHPEYGSYLPGLYHLGRDLPRPAGTPVYSVGDGKVVYAGSFGTGVPGSAMFVQYTAADGSPFQVLYGHVNIGVASGSSVSAGQQIATVYDQGANSHLHLGISPGTSHPSAHWGQMPCSSWPATNGFVDPLPYLDAHPRNPPPGLAITAPLSASARGGWFANAPISFAYTVKNSTGGAMSIKVLTVAVRDPNGQNVDRICSGGLGVTLAAGQSWACHASATTGYGSTGTYTLWADWEDYSDHWHHGQLGPDQTFTLAASCHVPKVTGKKLSAAKQAIVRADCRVGNVKRVFSRRPRGTVVSQKPVAGGVRAAGAAVDLTVSKGRRR